MVVWENLDSENGSCISLGLTNSHWLRNCHWKKAWISVYHLLLPSDCVPYLYSIVLIGKSWFGCWLCCSLNDAWKVTLTSIFKNGRKMTFIHIIISRTTIKTFCPEKEIRSPSSVTFVIYRHHVHNWIIIFPRTLALFFSLLSVSQLGKTKIFPTTGDECWSETGATLRCCKLVRCHPGKSLVR